MDFLISKLRFLNGIFFRFSDRHIDFKLVALLFGEHKLLNFLRIADNVLGRGNIDHPPNDHLQLTDSSLIQFAKIISNFNDMKSFEIGQSSSIFSLGYTRTSDLVIPRQSAVDKVRAIRYANPK